MRKDDVWYNTLREEFPIVLDMMRKRSVWTFTIDEFTEVYNTVGSLRVSRGTVANFLEQAVALGLVNFAKQGNGYRFW